MHTITRYVACLSLITTLFAYSADSNHNNLCGQEYLALDDAYSIAINNALKSDDQESSADLMLVQQYFQNVYKDVMMDSTHEDAPRFLEELEKRSTRTYPITDIQYDLQVKNEFSGSELFTLDYILALGCEHANKNNRLDALLWLLCMRCALQKESIQLLMASTHADATMYKQEFFKKLAQCTVMQRQLLKAVQEQGLVSEEIDLLNTSTTRTETAQSNS